MGNNIKTFRYVTPEGEIKYLEAHECGNIGVDDLERLGIVEEVKPMSRLQQLYAECREKYDPWKFHEIDYVSNFDDMEVSLATPTFSYLSMR